MIEAISRQEKKLRNSGRTKVNGYIRILQHGHPRADRYGYVAEHVLVAEKALGHYLPPEAIVHHVNEVRIDNRNANLVICEDHPYHKLLHVRLRVLKAGGDPNTDKICTTCKVVRPQSEFSISRSAFDGLNAHCRSCSARLSKLGRSRRAVALCALKTVGVDPTPSPQ